MPSRILLVLVTFAAAGCGREAYRLTAPPPARHTGTSARTLAPMSPAARAATLQARRSARFVAWVRAWRAGLVPCDDAAAEITGDEEHMVSDVPGTWTDVSLADAMPSLSKLHPDEVRLVLPAPGDPRGLPGPGHPGQQCRRTPAR